MSYALFMVYAMFIAAPLLLGSFVCTFYFLFCERGWMRALGLLGPPVFFATLLASGKVVEFVRHL